MLPGSASGSPFMMIETCETLMKSCVGLSTQVKFPIGVPSVCGSPQWLVPTLWSSVRSCTVADSGGTTVPPDGGGGGGGGGGGTEGGGGLDDGGDDEPPPPHPAARTAVTPNKSAASSPRLTLRM